MVNTSSTDIFYFEVKLHNFINMSNFSDEINMNLKAFEKICSFLLNSNESFENFKVKTENFESDNQQNEEKFSKNNTDSTSSFNFVYQTGFYEICEKIDQINLIEKMDILKLNLIKNFYPILVF
jgi:hypothetical protein